VARKPTIGVHSGYLKNRGKKDTNLRGVEDKSKMGKTLAERKNGFQDVNDQDCLYFLHKLYLLKMPTVGGTGWRGYPFLRQVELYLVVTAWPYDDREWDEFIDLMENAEWALSHIGRYK